MADLDLDSLSLEELKSLKKQLDKAIDGYSDRQKRAAFEELDAHAKDLGFSLSEFAGYSAVKTRKPATAKYAHPDNADLTWSGRGRQPAWFAEALAAGKTREDLEIA